MGAWLRPVAGAAVNYNSCLQKIYANAKRYGMNRSTKDHRSDREGLVHLAVFVDQDTHREFKILAAEQGATTSALMHEAIAFTLTRHNKKPPKKTIDYLKKHHRPLPIARGTKPPENSQR